MFDLGKLGPNYLSGLICLFLLGFLATSFPGAAWSQALESKVVLIVDAQAVIRDSDAVASLQKTVEQRRQQLQQELLAQQEELRTEEQALIDRREQLTNEQFAEERRLFQEKIVQLQREVQARRGLLDQLYASGFSQVQGQLRVVVEQIAGERGASLVLQKTAVVLSSAEQDITEETLRRLNQSLPEVTLPADILQMETPGGEQAPQQGSGG
ncbi:OmpH family outer membrane protein [Limibacillus halophilus]|jgi:outer membrane protein